MPRPGWWSLTRPSSPPRPAHVGPPGGALHLVLIFSDFLSASGAPWTIEAASALSQSCLELSLWQTGVRCLACGSSSFVRTRTRRLRRILRRCQPKVLILKMSGLPVQNKTLLSESQQHRRSPSDKASVFLRADLLKP